jgi:transposase
MARRSAQVILTEIGAEMSRFPTAGHLALWAGMCPGNNESAGKHRSGRTRHGSKLLRKALIEAAQAASRSKDTYLAAQYAQIRSRRGPQRAAVAVGHSILVVAWHLLTTGEPYNDLGSDYFAATAQPVNVASLPNSKPWATTSPSNPPPELTHPRAPGRRPHTGR